MFTIECSASPCTAVKFCSPLGGIPTTDPPACTSTTIGPDHWLIEDAEVRPLAGNIGNNDIIDIGRSGTETTTTQLSTPIHLRKIWAHGDWTATGANGLVNGLNNIADGIAINCVYCSIMDSQVSEALRPGGEGHGILVGYGTQYKFNHNWIECCSSSIFAGGFSTQAGPSIPNHVPFQDVEIRRNRMTFPYAWLGQLTIPVGNAHWGGQSIVRKNMRETKEGERIVEVGNIYENADKSGGQSGITVSNGIRQRSGGGQGSNYQATINDLTFAYNIIRNGCTSFGPPIRPVTRQRWRCCSLAEANFWYHDVLMYNVTQVLKTCP